MALYITSLNSGSNGNCYYIGNATEAILVDVGLSCTETEKRIKGLGLLINKIKAIFISHEHFDHIKGLSTFANKFNLPIYITEATASTGLKLIKHLAKPFKADSPIEIGQLIITAFNKEHDAIDPHSFIIKYKNTTVGVFTDIGYNCTNVIKYFSQCNACFLEANYDEEMLTNGKYPQLLKDRIKSNKGHLSNTQALELFTKYRHPFLSHLILSHISKENNDENLVKNLFEIKNSNTKIIIASRNKASEIYEIYNNKLMHNNLIINKNATQLTLF